MNLHLLELQKVPIFEQLQLEEALLRIDERNFCVINRGSPRAIVMGLSSQPDQLLNLSLVKRDRIPVVKRFSGGGTVIIDESTLFITFLFAKKDVPIEPFPEPIHRWSAELYQKAWPIPQFGWRENDYVIGSKKCGGNAQYIRKDRWLHHTSFLWDYRPENMAYLSLPAKRPAYRQDRHHLDFLCRMKDFAESQEDLIVRLKKELVKRFDMKEASLEDLALVQKKEHRMATHRVDL